MENGIQVFENSEFGAVRVVDVNGEPWFVAKDVARALGYPESSIATISKLFGHVPDAWKGRNPIPTPGGMQDIPGEWKGRNWIMTPGGEQEMLSEDNALC